MSDTWRDYLATRPAPLDRVEVALLLVAWLWGRLRRAK
jgi:hypothetical protein